MSTTASKSKKEEGEEEFYYPRQASGTWDPVDVRPLLPIYPPPEPLAYPALPTPQRKPLFKLDVDLQTLAREFNVDALKLPVGDVQDNPNFLDGDLPFDLTTHIIPSCHLRTGRFEPIPSFPADSLSKEERAKVLARYKEELRFDRGHLRTDGYPKVLWNCVNRYVRRGVGVGGAGGTGLTLFFAHANGFPKEIWEPTLAVLFASPAGKLIDEVWAWESVQHGDAALLNRESLSKYFDWQDNTRDIVNFLTNYLPTRVRSEALPLHLERIPEEEAFERRESGYRYRRLMAVGHSYGGCTTTLAVENFPKLFDSLVLIDPVMAKPYQTEEVSKMSHGKTDALLLGSLTRRDTWKSREDALTSYLRNPFFAAWHPAVLAVYIESGLYSTTTTTPASSAPTPAVKLKMPGMYESILFSERYVSHEAYQGLPFIEARIPIRWVMPGRDDGDEFGAPGATAERCWVRGVNVSNIRVRGAGHLIAQERPVELGEDLEAFILKHYARLVPEERVVRASL
ncbi:hypothetical protein FA15DRAFT_674601 [Coprinopsis marcescibilis]|uniref:AB hydrolase-1 domain-containing protein n=1 Tax=Coprinopsis marcescibilis TaxID=230819 RepID=A0A5C3KGL3_COPMA|nr:hypothetical protein FA15DRAFT_674601 [Coprinopsis marcescibilis]